jgi:hypothetical protein
LIVCTPLREVLLRCCDYELNWLALALSQLSESRYKSEISTVEFVLSWRVQNQELRVLTLYFERCFKQSRSVGQHDSGARASARCLNSHRFREPCSISVKAACSCVARLVPTTRKAPRMRKCDWRKIPGCGKPNGTAIHGRCYGCPILSSVNRLFLTTACHRPVLNARTTTRSANSSTGNVRNRGWRSTRPS